MSEDIGAWFASRLPKTWFAGPPEVTSDSEEILVIGELADVELAAGTAPEAREAARVARIDRFREETREERVKIAREAERRFRRKVAWGARCGDETRVFTTLSLPVMTRLRMPERRSEEHTSELQSRSDLVCRLLLEKKKYMLARLTQAIIKKNPKVQW